MLALRQCSAYKAMRIIYHTLNFIFSMRKNINIDGEMVGKKFPNAV